MTLTRRIVGMSSSESDALLDMPLRHAETSESQCRFPCEWHAVAFWNNRCALHRATSDYHPPARHGYRATIRADRPV